MHVKVQSTTILETGRRPEWRYPQDHDTYPGESITDDAIYRAGGIHPSPDAAGWYEVSDENKPSHDPATEKPPKPKPQSKWVIKSDRVVRTWNAPEAKTVDERKNYLSSQAQGQFNAAIRNGFTDSDGVTWSAAGDARQRVMDLTQRIQEYRAGKMASALPNGKSTVKLRDVNNQPHDADPDKIVALAEQGSDFVDQAEDRLGELIASIEAATSHSDLDNVNVTAGWP